MQMSSTDPKKIEEGVRLILEGIGEDLSREGLVDTPERVAASMLELCRGMQEDASVHFEKSFFVGEPLSKHDPVCVRDIPFYSLCEHHLLPFFGTVSIVYLPAEKDAYVCGLSKLARVVETFARRPQIQERLGVQIAKAIEEGTHARAVMVRVEAEHLCMSARGVQKPGSHTITLASRGLYEIDPELSAIARSLIG